jgi:hypothetical protein
MLKNEEIIKKFDCNYLKDGNNNIEGIITLTKEKVIWNPKKDKNIYPLSLNISNIFEVKKKTNDRIVKIIYRVEEFFFFFGSDENKDSFHIQLKKLVNEKNNSGINFLNKIKSKTLCEKENKYLLRVFLELVGKFITEQDFWSQNKNLLQNRTSIYLNSNCGINNNFIYSLKKKIRNEKITMNVKNKSLIFTLFPAIKKTFDEYVPNPISEKDFWLIFMKSSYIDRG